MEKHLVHTLGLHEQNTQAEIYIVQFIENRMMVNGNQTDQLKAKTFIPGH